MGRQLALTLILSSLLPLSVATGAGQASATVSVDASVGKGPLNNPILQNNLSYSAPLLPPASLALAQTWRHDYVRAWIKPADYYIGAGVYDFTNAYPYLDQAASAGTRLLVNFGSDNLVQSGRISHQDYQQVLTDGLIHYKTRYPGIEYIEALNEPDLSNRLDESVYYLFFQDFYRAINAANAALNPDLPLKVGGPVLTGFKSSWIQAFLDDYANDPSGDKALGFIAYHQYGRRSTPALMANEKSDVAGWLAARGLDPQTPVFVTEYGPFPGSGSGSTFNNDVLTQAAAMASYGYFYEQGGMDKVFHWVMDHVSNDRKDQFLDGVDGGLSPYGCLLQMQLLLKQGKIQAASSALDGNGIGVTALATSDATGVAVMVWNYQSVGGRTGYAMTLNIANLPFANYRVERYLIDGVTSNYYGDPSVTYLQKVEDVMGSGIVLTRTQLLDVNAIMLLVLTPVS